MVRAAYHHLESRYPTRVPFDPPPGFPELVELLAPEHSDSENIVYGAVREVFRELELDAGNFATARWNPLRELVREGQHVVIKPNLVTHQHHQGAEGLTWSLTHPSVIRAIADYSLIAVGPRGQVTIADVPIENCDFDALCEATGLRRMVDCLRDRGHTNIALLDLRTYQTTAFPDGSSERVELSGDPRGYTDVDLGEASFFHELESRAGPQNYYTLGDHTVDHFDPRTRQRGLPNLYHSPGKHVYHVANTILDADLVVSAAKLKTHKFSGVTLCLKNAIGISHGKEYLPHRRPGPPEEGGDSFPQYPSRRFVWRVQAKRKLFSLIGGRRIAALRKLVRRYIPAPPPHLVRSEPLFGNWSGNDTIWRTTLDLNMVLNGADRHGQVHPSPQRRYLAIIDGVIGMDHEAPMEGLPVRTGLVIAARDAAAADALDASLMGFDWQCIPTIERCSSVPALALGDPRVATPAARGNVPLESAQTQFVPAKGWEVLGDPRSPRPSQDG